MKKSLVLTVLSLFVFLSCDDNANKSKIDAQVKKNEPLYLSEKTTSSVLSKPVNDEDYSDFMRTPNGLLYKFYVINEGVTLTNDDVVEIRMNYFLNDSLLFSSQNFPKRFDMPVESSVFKGDLYEGLSMMHVGDSASFVVRADSTYIKLWKKPAIGVDANDVVRFDIAIVSKEDRDVFSQRVYAKKRAQAEASRNDLQVYLHDNNIVEKPRPSGLIVETIIEGYGEKATSGDVVRVHYTAELLDGTLYKSTRSNNIPEILSLRDFPNTHPRGLSEAIHQMREGEVAKVIIPSHLAFGQQEVYNLPPFANFVYEIELLEIMKINK